jgi:hypothetical protein
MSAVNDTELLIRLNRNIKQYLESHRNLDAKTKLLLLVDKIKLISLLMCESYHCKMTSSIEHSALDEILFMINKYADSLIVNEDEECSCDKCKMKRIENIQDTQDVNKINANANDKDCKCPDCLNNDNNVCKGGPKWASSINSKSQTHSSSGSEEESESRSMEEEITNTSEK